MKLPKDLQKKKQQMEDPIERLKKKILQTFRSEFINTMRKFDDKRKPHFKKIGDKGIFSYNFVNEMGELKKMQNFIYLYRGEAVIEIYFNYKELNEQIFFQPEFRQNFDFIKGLFKHIAHHEYGHTFLTPTTFDLGLEEGKEFLKRIGISNFRGVPIEKINEYNKIIKNTRFFKALENLKKVELNLLYDEFKEFHAYYMVLCKKICIIPPQESLNRNYNILSGYISNLLDHREELLSNLMMQSELYQDEQLNMLPHDAYFELYHDINQSTYDFFIYGEWDRLIGLFSENNMTYFLYFMHTINEIFKTISDKHSDIDIITKIIIKLSKIMDEINYKDLIFDNKFNEKLQDDLKKFMTELEQNELIIE